VNFSKFASFLTQNTIKKIAYQFYESEGPVFNKELGVICVHDLLFNKTTFTELAQSLSKIINVACVDLPGHGNSDPLMSYDFESFVNSCFCVINNCGFKRIIWIGHALGACIGVKLASMSDSPIISLILDEFIPKGSYADLKSPIMEINNCSTLVELAEKMNNYLQIGVILKDRMQFGLRNFDLRDGLFQPSYDRRVLESVETFDLESDFYRLTQPTLLFSCKDSTFTISKRFALKKNIILDNLESNHISRYSIVEKEKVACWIKSLLKGQIKNPFEVGIG
jgi:pimeloyl-ACP methyl ester carboxylesterase